MRRFTAYCNRDYCGCRFRPPRQVFELFLPTAPVPLFFGRVVTVAKRTSEEWRQLVRDALSESNPETLPVKIALADFAVWQRMEQIKAKTGNEVAAERDALEDAIRSLADLKRHHFPGWDTEK